ncbi:glycosyltransferase [Ferrimicrobium acidiphilum]|uniref:D-inositol 3-phosphate glycosyltransferase n=1 Tax=Ferrimicrobium acidiphilum DSM 19497 TaxID=1121877 RepID=A0A0D8FYQ1_9ACTN|nr:glycosyltransferase [Ferrimicrobium acidiphilum]KJE77662.1 D-inositol 3-phosphate glycosyltransferase [Ferrimicrobium acidiphilum DSM 19497]
MISYHASPVAVPGSGVNGGMNVYVRALTTHLARAGVECDIFSASLNTTRVESTRLESGLWLHSLPVQKHTGVETTPDYTGIPEFADRVVEHMLRSPIRYDAVHANYWLSGVAAHRVKHDLDIPMITTFHTLEKAKHSLGALIDNRSSLRIHQEARILGCSDAVLASGDDEAKWLLDLYQAPEEKVVQLPLGIDRAFFSPGPPGPAREAIGFDDGIPIVLYVGRIQSLKGTALAVETLAHLLARRSARLIIVGGPSGLDGEREFKRVSELVSSHGLDELVTVVDPMSHELLSTYYRAADVVIVPSVSESFGLVALEAMGCGTPVVATDAGGLRTVVDAGRSGILVKDRQASAFAQAIDSLLANPVQYRAMSQRAASRAESFTWAASAQRLISVVDRIVAQDVLVNCMSCA